MPFGTLNIISSEKSYILDVSQIFSESNYIRKFAEEVGSNADSIPEEKNSLYCATKFGLKGFSQCLRLEIRGYNISISTISPGRVDTFFNNKKEGDRPTALKAKDVSKVVSFILDSCSNYCIDQVSLSSLLE